MLSGNLILQYFLVKGMLMGHPAHIDSSGLRRSRVFLTGPIRRRLAHDICHASE